ncbi:hypothetical protein Cfor_05617 [Coptotermes formosanus]|uniref:Mos1 transposase HTH domain-containing protein n=1 Tax=Coptotermes formosanus TaxID=36987 RepID=A0A6L2PXZ3_COPFO|nr:hypothetical protein Cfor_05617 [Coptotermes formosanus]
MKTQCGDPCLSLRQVYKWDRKFKNAVSSVADADHPGRPHTACTLEIVEHVEWVIQENCCVTNDEVTVELDISHGSAHHIIHDVLQYHKLCARWVPKQLTPELEERHMDACEELLGHYQTEGDAFLQRIVTGDETWACYFQPETKTVRKEWQHPNSSKHKKFRAQPSVGKMMLTLFWDINRPILEHYMS